MDTDSVLNKGSDDETQKAPEQDRPRRGDRAQELSPIDRMGREKRIPIGQQSRIKFKQRPGYVRRMVNDVADGERVKMFQKAGYSIVTEDTAGGDTRAGADTQVGSPVIRSVGGGVRGVLMEIPEEFYREDQAAKEERLSKIDDELKRKSKEPGFYGEMEVKR